MTINPNSTSRLGKSLAAEVVEITNADGNLKIAQNVLFYSPLLDDDTQKIPKFSNQPNSIASYNINNSNVQHGTSFRMKSEVKWHELSIFLNHD